MTDPAEELEYFLVARHLDRMMAIARELGDELVNARPPVGGANTAFAIVFHCCGMLEWWTRHAILGAVVDRDRDAEFVSAGTVSELGARVEAVTARLGSDLRSIDLDAPLAGDPGHYAGTPIGASARGVLLHVFEELAQHHGHLELTRDLLLGAPGA